jgi:hypothetical protein
MRATRLASLYSCTHYFAPSIYRIFSYERNSFPHFFSFSSFWGVEASSCCKMDSDLPLLLQRIKELEQAFEEAKRAREEEERAFEEEKRGREEERRR